MLQQIQNAFAIVDDFIFDDVIGSIQDKFSELQYSHHREHGYSAAEKRDLVNRYMHEQANNCCHAIYLRLQELDGAGEVSAEVPFTDAMAGGPFWGGSGWQSINAAGFLSPEKWMQSNGLYADHDVTSVMAMATCYCAARAFMNYGYDVEVYETTAYLRDGCWAMKVNW